MNKLSFFLKNLFFSPIYAKGEILFGYASQTGTAKSLAIQSADLLQAQGRTTSCLPLSQVDIDDLDSYQNIAIFTSTCGEGDIPDNGTAFYDKLTKRQQPLTTPVNIFALGDSSYQHFCEAGKLFNNQFQRLGAIEKDQLLMVDGAPQVVWRQWMADFSGIEKNKISISEPVTVHFTLNDRQALHGKQCTSDRGAYSLHLTLDQPSTNTQFQSGDLIGITPPNEQRERLYSVSAVFDEGVELCIGKVSYELDGEPKVGLCSNYLIVQLALGEHFTATHRKQGGLVLPKPEQPLLMVATGTGIAPMVCLLRERQEKANSTSNWLLFGNRHLDQDYYYQDELTQLKNDGVLTQLDLAFSRQGKEKVYVQDKLKQQRQQILDWLLEHGAQCYVCGQSSLKDSISQVLQQALVERLGDEAQAKEQYQSWLNRGQLIFEVY